MHPNVVHWQRFGAFSNVNRFEIRPIFLHLSAIDLQGQFVEIPKHSHADGHACVVLQCEFALFLSTGVFKYAYILCET